MYQLDFKANSEQKSNYVGERKERMRGASPLDKTKTNSLKKNVSIGLQCKKKTKVKPHWWKKRKDEGHKPVR